MAERDWWLDERAYAGAEHLDPAYVAAYGSKAGFDPYPDVQLLRDLGSDASQTLVDLGAGDGTFALAAAEVFGRVVAVDVSPAMLDVLRHRIDAGRTANVEVVAAGLLSYAHEGAPADVVYCRNALHQLPDLWKAVALDRIAAILRPRGLLRLRDVVLSVDPSGVAAVVEEWLDAAPTDPRAGWTRAELATHLRGEYSTFSWLLEPMLARAGFAIEDASYSAARTHAGYLCRRR